MSDHPYLDYSEPEAVELPVSKFTFGVSCKNPTQWSPVDVPAPPRALTSATEVRALVATEYHTTPHELLEGPRYPALNEARCVAFWMLREAIGFNMSAIGRVMGRDHTTVIAGVRKCERLRNASESFRERTDALLRRAKGAVG